MYNICPNKCVCERVLSTRACSYSHYQYTIVRMSTYLFITLNMFIY